MVTKHPLSGSLRSSNYPLSLRPDYFIPAIISIPLGFMVASIVQSDVFASIVGLVCLGVLTSLDLRSGPSRTAMGFLVSILGILFVVETSGIGGALSVNQYPSLVLVAFPPALGTVISTFIFPSKTRFRIPKENILISIFTSIGLGMASLARTGGDLSPTSIFWTSAVFIPLAIGANAGQTLLLHFLEKFWNRRQCSHSMMPAFAFSLNPLTLLAFLAIHDNSLVYTFLSSFILVPLLSLTGIGVYGFTQKVLPKPRTDSLIVNVSGDRSVRVGQSQVIRIGTSLGGTVREMNSVNVAISDPSGKRDNVKPSHKGVGKYQVAYLPRLPGTYKVEVDSATKDHVTGHGSFSFVVPTPNTQPPSSTRKPILPRFGLGGRSGTSAPHPPSKPVAIIPQPSPRPVNPPALHPTPAPYKPSIPPAAPAALPSIGSLPKLDNWDPRLWIGQDVHGYKIKEHIATGATGYVLRASFGQAGAEMALKIPILKTNTGPTALNETMAEATTLLELSGQSKYVVQIKGIMADRLNVQEIIKGDTGLYLHSPPSIVMEFMRGGNAKRLVEDPSYDSLYYSEKWPKTVAMIGQMISSALKTIHSAGFVHLDIKPQNILFNTKPPTTGQDMVEQMSAGTLLPKLADLGSAVRIGGKVVQFTTEYAPAEQVMGIGADPSMDIYALGATMYNLLTKTPIHSKRLIDAMNRIVSDSKNSGDELKSIWKSFNPDYERLDSRLSPLVDVMEDMMNREPKKRPSAGDVADDLKNVTSKF